MMSGTVKWFDDTKGYGFITLEDGAEVFVHYSVIVTDGYKTLNEGETVELEIRESDRGLQAASVRRLR